MNEWNNELNEFQMNLYLVFTAYLFNSIKN